MWIIEVVEFKVHPELVNMGMGPDHHVTEVVCHLHTPATPGDTRVQSRSTVMGINRNAYSDRKHSDGHQ